MGRATKANDMTVLPEEEKKKKHTSTAMQNVIRVILGFSASK